MAEDAKPSEEQILADAMPLAPPQTWHDERLIKEQLGQARAELAQAKLTFHAGRHGIPGTKGHDRQHIGRVNELRQLIAFLEEALDGGLPEPPEVVLEVPTLVSVPDTGEDPGAA